MSNQRWFEPFISAAVDGTALANSTAATAISPPSSMFTIPSTFYESIDGKTIRLKAKGRISTVVTTPGTLTLDVRFGSVVVFNGGAMALNIVAQTNVNWSLEADLVIRAVGKSTNANILGMGEFRSHAVIGAAAPTAGGAGVCMLPFNTAPVAGTGFDSTAAQAIELFATWSVANAANSIQVHQYSLVSLN